MRPATNASIPTARSRMMPMHLAYLSSDLGVSNSDEQCPSTIVPRAASPRNLRRPAQYRPKVTLSFTVAICALPLKSVQLFRFWMGIYDDIWGYFFQSSVGWWYAKWITCMSEKTKRTCVSLSDISVMLAAVAVHDCQFSSQ